MLHACAGICCCHLLLLKSVHKLAAVLAGIILRSSCCGNCVPRVLAEVVNTECVDLGMQDNSLVTVWSAPNYCYRCGNVASVLCFNDALQKEVKYFTETQENGSMMTPRNTVPYFI